MQDATSSNPEEAKNKCSASDVPDISTVQDTEQKLTFKGPRTSNSSDKEPKSGEWHEDAETDSLKHQASQDATEVPGSLTVRDTEQKPTSKGLRTSIRQKKPPTIKNNDFLW